MGQCRYCGKEAGFIRNSHKDCENRYKKAVDSISNSIYTSVTKMPVNNSLLHSLSEKAVEAYIPASELKNIITDAWDRALQHYLEDGILSEEEENTLVTHAKSLNISSEDMRTRDVFTRVAMGRAIRNVIDGKIPDFIPVPSTPIPFNFQKSEKTLWIFTDVDYAEENIIREYITGSRGVSVKIAKGVHYRIGASRGHVESHSEMQVVDKGMLAITTKHIYYAGQTKSFRISYQKIVSFQSFTNAVGLVKEAARPKTQMFMVRDGWFIYNLMVNAAQIEWG